MAFGGVVGQLFIVFGVRMHHGSFKAAHGALNALRVAAGASVFMHAARSLTHFAAEAAETATHVKSMSQAMGMSMDVTQKWTYIAEQSGSNLKELAVGVSMLQGNLRKLANNQASPRLAQMFREMGVTRQDAIAARDNVDGVNVPLMKMAATLKRIGTSGEASAVMRGLVGARAGRALTADLIRGPEAIEQMFKRLQDIGGVVSDKANDNLMAMFDMLVDVKKAWHGITSEILGSMAPALNLVLNDLVMWFSQNKELIADVLITSLKVLVGAFKLLMAVISTTQTAWRALMSGDTGMITLATIFTYILLRAMIPALLRTAATAGMAFVAMLPMLAAMALPAIALGAIITAVVLLIKHWDVLVDAVVAFGKWFGGMAADIASAIGRGIIIGLTAAGRALFVFGSLVKRGFLGALEAVGAFMHRIIDPILDAIDRIKKFLASIFTSKGDTPAQQEQAMENAKMSGVDPELYKVEPSLFHHPEEAAFGAASTMPPPGSPAAMAAVMASRASANVSIGPTTVNITGVKDAAESQAHIADAIDNQHRHAFASMGGEVQ